MRELRERAGQIVKGVCLILAIVVVCQLAGVVSRWNPFRGVTVPELPVLASATNSPAEGTPKTNHVAATAAKGTNGAANGKTPGLLTSALTNTAGTNPSLSLASSKTNSVPNSVAAATSSAKGTSSVVQAEAAVEGTNGTTNAVAASLLTSAPTNAASANAATITATDGATNAMASGLLTSAPTNAAATNAATITATNGATNGVAASFLTSAPTNAAMLSTNQVTNLVVSAAAGTNALAASGTNAAAAKLRRHQPGGPPMPGMAGKHGADLPPAVQARIQQITDSELLAPVMHPLPMALLGIAGEVAFLRSANGQTGMVKEGDSLGDLKLLRIGINRVLIEQDGQKQELMIFSGYGGDSLLPTNSTNENNHP